MAISEDSNFVEFQYNWEFDIRPLNTYNFNECFQSEQFKTVYNNIGFEWKLDVYPGGVKVDDGPEFRSHIGVFLQYLGGLYQKLESVKLLVFVGRNVSQDFLGRGFQKGKGGSAFGNPKLLAFNGCFEELIGEGFIQRKICDPGKYMINFGVRVLIPKEHFDWKKLMEKKKQGVAPETRLNVAGFFDEVTIDTSPGKRPERDRAQVLDFKILTNDGFIIWCHKNILSRKNQHFCDIMSSGKYKEATENQVDVSYDKKMMMGILRFIYTDEVPKDFPDEIGEVIKILEAGHFFEVKGLILHCEGKLIENLLREKCMDLAVEMLCLADRYGMDVLREISLNLASENIGKIMYSGFYTDFAREQLWKDVGVNCEKRGRVVKVPCVRFA